MRQYVRNYRLYGLVLAMGLCLPIAYQANQPASQTASLAAPQAAQPAQLSQPASEEEIAKAVADWWRLAHEDGADTASFEELSGFLAHNIGWPDEHRLRILAEKAIALEDFDSGAVLAYFEIHPPLSASGHLRHALALKAAGKVSEAYAAARRAWTEGTLEEVEETALLLDFAAALTLQDHDIRIETLLWSSAGGAEEDALAKGQLARISATKRPSIEVRLAMREQASNALDIARQYERANPTILRDAGYIRDKVRWLDAHKHTAQAFALLAIEQKLTAPPHDAETWLELRLRFARKAEKVGDYTSAYHIARQIDSALPEGQAVREAAIGIRDDYTSLAWLAGRLALGKLAKPREAAEYFQLYGDAARSSQTRSKGYYWSARAAESAGDRKTAAHNFAQAALYYEKFYGQLARERLGMETIDIADIPALAVAESDYQAFANDRLSQATRYIGTQTHKPDYWRVQSKFLRTIARRATTPAHYSLASRFAEDIGRPDLAVMSGWRAQANAIDALAIGGFPTISLPKKISKNSTQWTFVHAIARQESQFDHRVVSHAGARGTMQLIPQTAQETARKLKLPYRRAALTSDADYNIRLGSAYFQSMLKSFDGSYPLALAAYNAGPTNVRRWLRRNGDPRTDAVDIIEWIEAIPIYETRNYVQRVLENAVIYDQMNPNRKKRGKHRLPDNLLNFYLGYPQPR